MENIENHREALGVRCKTSGVTPSFRLSLSALRLTHVRKRFWQSTGYFMKARWLGLCFLLLPGCLAQQADLAKIQKDLENRIDIIKQEKKELQEEVVKAKEAIAQGEQQRAAINSETEKLVRFRAEMKRDFKTLRDEDLRIIYGQIEELEKFQQDLSTQTETGIERLQTKFMDRTQALESQATEQRKDIASNQKNMTALIQQIEENGQSTTQTMNEFQSALSGFKTSMADLLGKEEERATTAEAELGQQLEQTTQSTLNTLQTDLEKTRHDIQTTQQQEVKRLEQQIQTHTANLQEVTHSIAQMREAFGNSITPLGTQVDSQAGQIVQHQNQLTQLEAQVTQLTEKLQSDTQTLKTYLDQDVKNVINSLAKTMEKNQQQISTLQDTIQGIDSQVQSESTQLQAKAQELNQTVFQLKEAQAVMGNLLGKRGDDVLQKAGQLTERLNQIEGHQSELDNKVATNTQSTSHHLTEVNASIHSITEALEKTSGDLASRISEQESRLADLTTSLQQVKTLNDRVSQVQESSQVATELQNEVKQMTVRLQDLENHQSNLAEKLDANTQNTTTYLTKVNNRFTSVTEALEQVNSDLNSRIEEQGQQINKSLTASQAAQSGTEASEANIAHLNRLTETVNQLREVVNTIGTKLGQRVDEHEDQLGELVKRINRLQGKKSKK